MIKFNTVMKLKDSSLFTCGLLLPPNPIVTTVSTVVAPKLVRAAISPPLFMFVSQNVTQDKHTIKVSGMYI